MSARVVEWSRGARWLGEGWRLFRAAPLSWIMLVFAYYLLMTLASLLPLVGIAAVWVLAPPFSVGFMAASRAAARGGPVALANLFSGLRENLRHQLALGGLYLVCVALVLGATTLVHGDALAQWILAGKHSDDVIGAMQVAAVFYLPVMMMFWFAPVLVAWHGIGVVKALFFSLIACLLNWRAFLVYAAAAMLMTMTASFLALSALLFVSGGTLVDPIELVIPLLLVMPVLFASFYVSYRDVFGAPEPA